jgi:D-serine deaminase-like pyridoxal phosphate-dependent protein
LNPKTEKPFLLIDEDRCKKNILRMAERARSFGCEYRPHFKTHQSHEIGQWVRNEGVTGITVSSTSMALYFAADGWDDITIAFPFYDGMLPDLVQLQGNAELRLFLHSPDQIAILDENLDKPVRFYIEIDAGYGRSGIKHSDTDTIDRLISAAESSANCRFHGFYIHDGGTYAARGRKEIVTLVSGSLQALLDLGAKYPKARLSLGDTPSASVCDGLKDVHEMTPGNFVFYDWMQTRIGSCEPDDVALFAVLPVAQKISGDKAIVHGGAVHMSKDYIMQNGAKNFGQIVDISTGTTEPVNGCYLSALSQEHGTVSGYSHLGMNERIVVCPIHSCLTANLFDHYRTKDGRIIKKRILS